MFGCIIIIPYLQADVNNHKQPREMLMQANLGALSVIQFQKNISSLWRVICMKPEIRKIVTRSSLFFGILAVSAAGMQLAAWHQLNRNCKMHAAPRGTLLFLS